MGGYPLIGRQCRVANDVRPLHTEAGKGIGKVLQGFGKAIGGIFGGGDDKAPKQ